MTNASCSAFISFPLIADGFILGLFHLRLCFAAFHKVSCPDNYSHGRCQWNLVVSNSIACSIAFLPQFPIVVCTSCCAAAVIDAAALWSSDARPAISTVCRPSRTAATSCAEPLLDCGTDTPQPASPPSHAPLQRHFIQLGAPLEDPPPAPFRSNAGCSKMACSSREAGDMPNPNLPTSI